MEAGSPSPSTVQVTEGLDGIQVRFNSTHRFRSGLSHLGGGLIALAAFTVSIQFIDVSFTASEPTGQVMVLQAMKWFNEILSHLHTPVLLFFASTVAGLYGGFILWSLLNVVQQSSIEIRAHELLLPSERVPLSEILFIQASARPMVVLRDGRRIKILRRSERDTRIWVSRYLRRQLQGRISDDSPADIPAALAQLQQTTVKP